MLGIVSLKGQYSVAWGIQGALSLVASVPTLVVFLFFQRYFIAGMTMARSRADPADRQDRSKRHGNPLRSVRRDVGESTGEAIIGGLFRGLYR